VGFGWISLLTDYGLEDGFVAACHGVIAVLAPEVRVIDITHLVAPADVDRGAVVLAQTVGALPPAVHVAVVDPGVGGERRGIAVAAGASVLVGPDNGLLLPAAETLGGVSAAYELSNAALWRQPVAATFHGRDVFCPVAAQLATGLPLDEVGDRLDPGSLVTLPVVHAVVDGARLEAGVASVDRFGNVQLGAAPPDAWRPGQPMIVEIGEAQFDATYVATFAGVEPGAVAVFADSAGLAAVAVNLGRAADRLGVRTRSLVVVRPAD
jgi:S-adenosyl-L-methionine hydrolase (adenosine-forming)